MASGCLNGRSDVSPLASLLTLKIPQGIGALVQRRSIQTRCWLAAERAQTEMAWSIGKPGRSLVLRYAARAPEIDTME
jgi:hypothetical protein